MEAGKVVVKVEVQGLRRMKRDLRKLGRGMRRYVVQRWHVPFVLTEEDRTANRLRYGGRA